MSKAHTICFIFLVAFCATAYAGDCDRYSDRTFGYSICLPDSWKKSYKDIGYRHVITARRKNGVEITVAASRYDDEEKEKWKSWRRWYAYGSGGIRNVVESLEVPSGKNVKIKILVFDYSYRGRRMIQRTMLTNYGENILVVECRAPIKSYGRHTRMFNIVMSSLDLTGELQGEDVESLKDAGFRPDRHRIAKPDAVEKKKKEPKPITDDTNRLEPKPITDDTAKKKKEPEKEPVIFRKKTDTDGLKDPDQSELDKLRDLEEKGLIEKVE